MLDAGDEPWGSLLPFIARILDELVSGEVLEVISSAGTIRVDLLAWCTEHGHELMDTLVDGDKTSFRIRRGA